MRNSINHVLEHNRLKKIIQKKKNKENFENKEKAYTYFEIEIYIRKKDLYKFEIGNRYRLASAFVISMTLWFPSITPHLFVFLSENHSTFFTFFDKGKRLGKKNQEREGTIEKVLSNSFVYIAKFIIINK